VLAWRLHYEIRGNDAQLGLLDDTSSLGQRLARARE
jgi:hypothetical protein